MRLWRFFDCGRGGVGLVKRLPLMQGWVTDVGVWRKGQKGQEKGQEKGGEEGMRGWTGKER